MVPYTPGRIPGSGSTPVSYTHLDVYKRQASMRLAAELEAMELTVHPGHMTLPGRREESMKLLDVYKRQVPGCFNTGNAGCKRISTWFHYFRNTAYPDLQWNHSVRTYKVRR